MDFTQGRPPDVRSWQIMRGCTCGLIVFWQGMFWGSSRQDYLIQCSRIMVMTGYVRFFFPAEVDCLSSVYEGFPNS